MATQATRNQAGVQYFGIFFSKREQQKLRSMVPPLFNQKTGDHLTLAHDPTDDQLVKFSKLIGKKVVVTLTHEFANERVQAVTPKKGSIKRVDGKDPHVTIAWKDGASPAESNQLVRSAQPRNQMQPWVRIQGVYDVYPRTLSEDDDVTATQRALTAFRTHMEDMTQAQSMALVTWLSAQAQKARIAEHVYVVGGAVRNFVIGQPIKDIDVTIDVVALAGKKPVYDSETFAKFLAQRIPARTNLVVNQYGVAILTVAAEWDLNGHPMKGEQIEIANTRTEKYGGTAGKGYKPGEVSPANIDQDILRREFTFNTLLWRLSDMAKGPDKAEILDLTGRGLRDLKAREMRTPIDPDKTFSDDPTRMLRAIKFAVKYGMKLPKDMIASIQRNASKLQNPPAQAIVDLLNGYVLQGKSTQVRRILDYMVNLGLMEQIKARVKREKLFATMLSNKLKGKSAKTLLHVLGLGLEVKTDLSFLTGPQQQILRGYARRLSASDLSKLLALLKRPLQGKSNINLINKFGLKGAQRALPIDVARQILLDDPRLASRMAELLRRVEVQLKQRLGENTMDDLNLPSLSEMRHLISGGTAGGRGKLTISEADSDVNSGDIRQEEIAKKRLLETMTADAHKRRLVDKSFPIDVDVFTEMEKGDVAGLLQDLKSKMTKRCKTGREGEARRLGAAAARYLDKLSNTEVQDEATSGAGDMSQSSYTAKPKDCPDAETLKQTQDLKGAGDDSQDAGAMKKNPKAGNDRGKKDPIGEALAAFRGNRQIAESGHAPGTMPATTYTNAAKARPAGESGNTCMDPLKPGKKKKSNAFKDAPGGNDRGAKDPIGEDAAYRVVRDERKKRLARDRAQVPARNYSKATGVTARAAARKAESDIGEDAKGLYKTLSTSLRGTGVKDAKARAAQGTRGAIRRGGNATGAATTVAKSAAKRRGVQFGRSGEGMDTDFDGDGDVDEKDMKFNKNTNSKAFKARVGDPKDKVKDEQISEAKERLSKALARINKRNAPPGGWSDADRVKPAVKKEDENLEERDTTAMAAYKARDGANRASRPVGKLNTGRQQHDAARGVKKIKPVNVNSERWKANWPSDSTTGSQTRKRKRAIARAQARERPGNERRTDLEHVEGISEARAAYADAMRKLPGAGLRFDSLWDKMNGRSADMRDDKTALKTKVGGSKSL